MSSIDHGRKREKIALCVAGLAAVASVALGVGGSNESTRSLSTEIFIWGITGGAQQIQAVADAANAALVVGNNPASQRAVCVNLGQVVDRAADYAPIPDEATQWHWLEALRLLKQASVKCVTGFDTGNLVLLKGAEADARAALAQVQQADAQVRTIQSQDR